MASKRHQKASDLFHAASEIAPDARAAFLEEACAGDTKLRAEVVALLAQDQEHPSFLETPKTLKNPSKPGHTTRTGKPPAGAAAGHTAQPEQIGPYRILEKIGEGGMGVVYVAEQREPVRRKVALKVIKLGMDTKQVLARFEVEHHALTIMNHPNIARVYDAGATPEGRPYFVMEHVPGIPINDYCDRHLLNTRQRLEMFIPVCHAVQHAHQKSVIHRDLKPSNVLVMMQDGKPVPKIIDFGVAKATGQRLTERTLHTEIGQVIGTPEYMSPEQAEMTAIDIDTRTDIYSLGVILYELLVGALPFDPKSLRQAGYAQIQRIIREIDPPRPSMRLSSLGGEDSKIAAKHRDTDAHSLARHLRGDLDWIIMKALEKDRTRRYETANGLGLDVQRHLNNEPVLASPPSATYQLSRFVRRNRTGVAAAGVIALVLLAATGVSIRFALSEADQRVLAEQQSGIAEAVNEFLNNDLLAAVAPEQQGKDVSMREVLNVASRNIEGKFTDQPLVEASIRATLGNVYLSLGEFDQAQPHLERALNLRRAELGEEHPKTLRSMISLANMWYYLPDSREAAEDVYTRAFEIQKRVLGSEHPDTLYTMAGLAYLYLQRGRYVEGELMLQQALETQRRILGRDHPQTLEIMSKLVWGYREQGRYDQAELLVREVLETRRRVLGEDHPSTLASVAELGFLLLSQRRYAEAELQVREVLAGRRRVLGEEHPATLWLIYDLARVLEHQGKHAEAETLSSQALAMRRLVLGREHPDTLMSMLQLAWVYEELGRYDEAVALRREIVEIRKTLLETRPGDDENQHQLIHAYQKLGEILEQHGSAADVRSCYHELKDYVKSFVQYEELSADVFNCSAMALLAWVEHDLRDPVTALEFAKKAIKARKEPNPNFLDTLALAQQMNGDLDAAIETQTKAVGLLPPGPSTLRSELESNLVKYLLEGQRFAQAEPLLLAMHQQLVGSPPRRDESPSKTQSSIERLAKFYESWHAAEPGQGYDSKAAEWRAKLPPDDEAAEPTP